MPKREKKKCESCKHYGKPTPHHTFGAGRCIQQAIGRKLRHSLGDTVRFHTIEFAREICDREGDGIFVYFEPKDPATGASVSSPHVSKGAANPEATQPNDWRRDLNLLFRTAGGL